MRHSQIACQTEDLLEKKFFESMFSLKSGEMDALLQNDILTFSFYAIISTGIPNRPTFVKEVF